LISSKYQPLLNTVMPPPLPLALRGLYCNNPIIHVKPVEGGSGCVFQLISAKRSQLLFLSSAVNCRQYERVENWIRVGKFVQGEVQSEGDIVEG